MKPYNEIILDTSPLHIKIAFHTKAGGYLPLHWHEEVEILYPLNGESDVFIDGEVHHQKNRQLLVIDSSRVHSVYHHGDSAMFLCIHVTKKALEWYVPRIEDLHICCEPGIISEATSKEISTVYQEMCDYLKQITELYIRNSPVFLLEAEGLILQMIAMLIQYFSTDTAPLVRDTDKLTMNRIRTVIDYVESHFTDPISLLEMADLLGFRKEYFCRFFKKNIGISFLQYLNTVRASHIYQDLIHTEEPIQALMEKNGFTNQKLFNHTFKQLYGCTPSQIRKM